MQYFYSKQDSSAAITEPRNLESHVIRVAWVPLGQDRRAGYPGGTFDKKAALLRYKSDSN
jgi:hypothetical protein